MLMFVFLGIIIIAIMSCNSYEQVEKERAPKVKVVKTTEDYVPPDYIFKSRDEEGNIIEKHVYLVE